MAERASKQAAAELQDGREAQYEAEAPALVPAVADVLALQRSAGNAAVARMLGADCFVAPPAESEDAAAMPAESHDEEGGEEDPGPDEEAPEEEAEELSDAEPQAARMPAPYREALWAAGADALAGPTPVPWTALHSAFAPQDGAAAIPGPSAVSLPKIQAPGGGNPWRSGWTSFPVKYKAPKFKFSTSSKKPKGGTKQWFAKPKRTRKADEGNSVCWFLGAGLHKTTHVEGGKPVYWEMSAAMSTLDSQAEGEHSSDTKLAFDMSLKEAQDVIDAHLTGKTFGPKATEAEVKQEVLDTITANLTHAGLGSDQAMWGTIYDTLFRKTLERDNKGWHTFALGGRYTKANGDVVYKFEAGTTNVGTTASAAIIKY